MGLWCCRARRLSPILKISITPMVKRWATLIGLPQITFVYEVLGAALKKWEEKSADEMQVVSQTGTGGKAALREADGIAIRAVDCCSVSGSGQALSQGLATAPGGVEHRPH